MILSHSSVAYIFKLARTVNPLRSITHRLKELNLSACQVAQHLLHLGFFCVLENRLFSQGFLAEGIGCLVSSRHCILQLFPQCECTVFPTST